MTLIRVVGESIIWYYSVGLGVLFRAWMNLHWFLYHYFSIPVLLKTFFAPFRRIREYRARGFDPKDIFEVLVVNTLMRAVGVLVRSVVIVIGFFTQVVLFVVCAGAYGIALASPVLLPIVVLVGIDLIFL
jgi:hypothetical protein